MISDLIKIDNTIGRMLEMLEDKPEAVAARLKRVREVLQLSKKDFAEGAGITMQTYGPFENGKRDLSLQSAKLLRKTYSLPLEFLYFGKTDDLPTRISKELWSKPSVSSSQKSSVIPEFLRAIFSKHSRVESSIQYISKNTTIG